MAAGLPCFLFMGGREAGLRLRKPRSIQSRRDFLLVQGKGKRLRGRHLLLMVRPGPFEEARVGWTVSRKVGGAVVRNRVRRRLREIVRQCPEVLCAGYDHVVIAFSSAAGAEFHVLREDLLCLFEQAQAWVCRRPSC